MKGQFMNLKYLKETLKKLYVFKDINNIAAELDEGEQRFILAKADELITNTFTFDKPWDMERCVKPYKLTVIDWEKDPNGDEEWCFMLNRMDYLNYLVMAYKISNNNDYFDKAKELILSWINSHKTIKPLRSTRTLDTAIRTMNIYEASIYMVNGLNDYELNIILENIYQQLEYLKNSYLTRYITSNWGSIQTASICAIIPLLIEDYENNAVYKFAVNELNRQVVAQVYSDGVQWEQSTMYHIEVLNYLMKYLYYAHYMNIQVDDAILDAAKKMADALLAQTTPNRTIETFGDSDRSNVEDVFARAAIIFEDPKYRSLAANKLDIESLYLLGTVSAKKYKMINSTDKTELYFDGIDSGMFTIKSSEKRDASFTMITNGSLGSGHGHSDNLHISIYHKGKPFMIDPGRYTYREGDPLRIYFKSMKSHNSMIIDNNEYLRPSSSWSYEDFGIVGNNYIRHIDNCHYFEGSLIGHAPLSIITRKVVNIGDGIWIIVDEIRCDGIHRLVKTFHLDNEADIRHKESFLESENAEVIVYSSEDMDIEDTVVSLRYNELKDSKKIVSTKEFTDSCTVFTIVAGKDVDYCQTHTFQNGETECSMNLVHTFEFKQNSKKYTVAIFHEEVYKGKKVFFTDGIPYHAKCVIVTEKNGTKKLLKMKA